MPSLYSYRINEQNPRLIVRVLAEDILQADEDLRRQGLNPMKYTVNIGCRMIFINTDLIKTIFVRKGLYPKDCEYRWTSGVIYSTPLLPSESEVLDFLSKSRADRCLTFNRTFLEYGPNDRVQVS